MYTIGFSRAHLMLTAAMVLGFSVTGPSFSWAEITSLTALSSKDIGPFNDKPYREIEARMEGTAPGGPYAVPITLVLPARAEDHNGFAVVDIINTVTIGKAQFVSGGEPLPLARGHMGDEFLFGRGNAYVGVMWDKTATDTLKIGTIAAPADGYTIIEDAAALARDPAKFLPADAGAAPELQQGHRLRIFADRGAAEGLVHQSPNNQDGALVFDGGLVAGASGGCQDPASNWQFCKGAIVDGGKIISLSTETDAEWGGYFERGESPDYRFLEIAGVSHIPATEADFRQDGMPDQKHSGLPAGLSRGAGESGRMVGREQNPPPSASIELEATPSKTVDGMESSISRSVMPMAMQRVACGCHTCRQPWLIGKQSGAPLGTYTGIAWNYEVKNGFFVISGTFTPFPPDKIKALYPTHETYVAAVAAGGAGSGGQALYPGGGCRRLCRGS